VALRLIEVVVPGERAREVEEAVAEVPTLGVWSADLADGRESVHILCSTEETETVTDLLSERFGRADDFRVVLLAVEATVPGPEEEDAEDAEGGEKSGAEADDGGDGEAKEPPDRISREELFQDVHGAARLSGAYLATVTLSALVAAVGLVQGEVAVIIGAMVIAPLLGPNVALALASTLGDAELAVRAGKSLAAGVAVGLVVSFGIGAVFGADPAVPELLARSRIDFADIAVALAAGSAGTLAYTTGLPAAVIGVMVAVALLPPLVATGLLAGAGHGALAAGAFLLLIGNIACINLAGVATFLAQRVRPRTWWEAERAKRATRLALSAWLGMLAVLAIVILLVGS
jgi:uncharacterized hydrophobic protein (TIGR00341 family)